MKRKIAFISEHASPLATLGGVDSGGQNVYVGELAKHLIALDYVVDVFTRWDDPKLPKVVAWVPGVRVVHVQAGPVKSISKENLLEYMPEFTGNMSQFISEEETPYVLIHANFWMSALVAADLKERFNIPFVVTFHALGYVRRLHQGDKDKFPVERIDIERRIVQEADHIIAECPQDRDDLINYYDAPSEKITIIPCGFNPHEFYPLDPLLARMVLGLDPSEKIILQLGRMVPRKGVDNVISALAKVKQMGLHARLIVVGGGNDSEEEMKRLMRIAEENDVVSSITFAGQKNREVLKYYYSASNLFITTPWYEPFGITPLESMACGTPVIGSNVGGIKYTVENGKTGYLVEPNDVGELAAKIYATLTDPILLKKLEGNAIRRVNSLFTWSKVSNMMASVYERLMLSSRSVISKAEQELIFIENAFGQAMETFMKSKQLLAYPILETASALRHCFLNNKKVLICGNGGSASESQHFASELVGRFELSQRQGLPAISLTSDNSIITAWSNDVGYEDVFARQVEAYGQRGDVLICLSTSGQSPNIINAMKMANKKHMSCIAMSGKGGGEMALYANVNIIVPSYDTQHIQELHLHIIHTICGLVEASLFGKKKNGKAMNGTAAVNGAADALLNEIMLDGKSR